MLLMNAAVTYNMDSLNAMARTLALGRGYRVQVGIFGEDNARSEAAAPDKRTKGGLRRTIPKSKASMTNAEVGAIHEFGQLTANPPIPPRSFLRMPLATKSRQIINGTAKVAFAFLKKADLNGLFTRIGLECENVVREAFASGGFGQWPKLSKYTVAKKGSSAILIDTGQLRRAIASKVKKS